jgi:hypothetical protein
MYSKPYADTPRGPRAQPCPATASARPGPACSSSRRRRHRTTRLGSRRSCADRHPAIAAFAQPLLLERRPPPRAAATRRRRQRRRTRTRSVSLSRHSPLRFHPSTGHRGFMREGDGLRVCVGDGLTTRHVLTGQRGPQPPPFTDDPEQAAASLRRLEGLDATRPWHTVERRRQGICAPGQHRSNGGGPHERPMTK